VALLTIIIIVIIGAAGIGYNFGTMQQQNANSPQYDSVQNQVNSLEKQVNSIQSNVWNLPLTNQTPTTRHVNVEWAEFQSAQDRFYPSTIIVNQGDSVSITFISNDTDAHTFTIGSPYNFQINASVPGTQDYLLNEKNFTTPPTNNSPGVKVWGAPGNVSATGSFLAKYVGIYEFFCVYHVQLGMFGYLIVLPNAAYNSSASTSVTGSTATTRTSSSSNASNPQVSIEYGSAANNTSTYYSPPSIIVVIGVNDTITWTNNDIAPHTVTADNGSFNSGNLNPGQSWTHVFTTPGTYTYHCDYHPWMKGTVIVESH
jgi:plastocyanin